MPFRKGAPPEPEPIPRRLARQYLEPKWVEARYPGRCSECDEWFEPRLGFMIKSDEMGGWVGECCDDPD